MGTGACKTLADDVDLINILNLYMLYSVFNPEKGEQSYVCERLGACTSRLDLIQNF
jgi:hypothetical protein